MSEKTILTAIPQQLRGRGHNRCIPMRCTCGCQFLFGLSDGTEGVIASVDQIDIKCPGCGDVTSEPTAPLRDGTRIFNGQAGLPAEFNQ
jgi:hypothetical protein